MSITIDAQVGERQRLASGSENAVRSGPGGDLIVSEAHGDLYEAARNGHLFVAANQTGVTTQAGLSATTPVLTLFNPPGSSVNAVICRASITFTVAFAAAAVIWLAANTNVAAAAVTGTAAIVRNAALGNGSNPACSAFTAATLPAAPVAVIVLGVGLTGAITTVPQVPAIYRDLDGALVLIPGAAISFQTSTASGASASFAELIWEEVPI